MVFGAPGTVLYSILFKNVKEQTWNKTTSCYKMGWERSCRGFSATIRTWFLRSFILTWSWGSRNGAL